MASWTAAPQVFDILQVAGDSLALIVELVDSDGVAIDLTGASGEAAVVAELGGASVLAPTVAVTDAAGGVFTVTDTAAHTAAVRPGTYRWGVRITWGDGTARTVLEGAFVVRFGPVL